MQQEGARHSYAETHLKVCRGQLRLLLLLRRVRRRLLILLRLHDGRRVSSPRGRLGLALVERVVVVQRVVAILAVDPAASSRGQRGVGGVHHGGVLEEDSFMKWKFLSSLAMTHGKWIVLESRHVGSTGARTTAIRIDLKAVQVSSWMMEYFWKAKWSKTNASTSAGQQSRLSKSDQLSRKKIYQREVVKRLRWPPRTIFLSVRGQNPCHPGDYIVEFHNKSVFGCDSDLKSPLTTACSSLSLSINA